MIYLAIALVVVLAVWLFLQHPQFGGKPAGKRLQRILRSPNFRNGQFQNLSFTPALAEGVTYPRVMRDFFFGPKERLAPVSEIPVSKTDLQELDPSGNYIVWFGHSSYLIQLQGIKILVDPVFSSSASPVPFMVKAFTASRVYGPEDLPAVDYLLITHDHYDHLDHQTILKLKQKVGTVITSLGVGAHLERWGYAADRIIETDWYDEVELNGGLRITAAPARHFSGRSFRRNTTLWSSFILEAPTLKIFIGGDSGYDTHFREIGERFGPFDLAILENGQYNESWKYIHMMPEEVVAAALDLKASMLMPVHWSRFSLALHAWDDPIIRVVEEAGRRGLPLLHPMIGELVTLDRMMPSSTMWWQNLK